MKTNLTLILLFISISSFSQVIENFDDPRIPKEMLKEINRINLENFETFSAEGSKNLKINEAGGGINYSYGVQFNNGFIVGAIHIKDGRGVIISSYEVRLPHAYCCNHPSRHCTKSKEEMRNLIRKWDCTNWKRADMVF